MRRLPRSFFARDSRIVARELLGQTLVHILMYEVRLSGRIVETEAYRPGDMAAHSFRGRTERNAPMFGRPGLLYVYFTYGMHFCCNITTETEGVGAAVLIRALEPMEGIEVMRANRFGEQNLRFFNLCRGPGNVCKAMAIDRRYSGYDMLQRNSALYVVGGDVDATTLRTSPRIGVSGDELAKTVEWRYYITGNPCVSGPKRLRI